ncbi:MAG: IS256 family transposase [Planctomycetota bacterium]|jgi:transposase-like protein
MMGKSYQRKTRRSKRKMPSPPQGTVSVETADGQVRFQMMLPMNLLLFDVAKAIEETASEAGLLMMKALIDEEVEQIAGPRYRHQSDRQATRWGQDEGHVIFAGRKMAMPKPRVRSRDGQEVPLSRYQAFAHPRRMQQAVSQRVLRRVSMRDYAGVLDDLCDGYGVDKSSVSRHWKTASTKQLKQMMERSLAHHDFCVLFLDGKEFHDFTLIVALGIDGEGRKHVLGLWPGATENAEVCGALLDDLIERGLSREHPYLFVLDGAKALRKAVVQRFGRQALIQRCRVHKKRNIQKYLPKKYHGMLSMKLKVAWEMTDYAQARQELKKVQTWLASINQAAARSLEEGFEETLTVNRLHLPSQLRRLLASTNIIESCFSLTGDLCGNVKRWRNALLINALGDTVDSQEAVA